MARKRILVAGRVQGVAYRAYAADEAMRLGLKGWVRNRKPGGIGAAGSPPGGNGQVEALVEGDDEAVRRFVEWCQRGSPAARVSNVVAQDDVTSEPLGPFEVRPTV